MNYFIKKYEIWIFLVLAPLINVGITYANSKGIITGFVYTHGRFYTLMLVLLSIIYYTQGLQGVKDLFRSLLNWKIHPKWYLFSLIFALAIGVLTLVLKSMYHKDLTYLPKQLNFGGTTLRNSFFLLTWAFVGEVVWVSYAVRKLSTTVKPFFASQIVGFFWALWWVPSILINTGVILNLPLWPLFINMMGAAGMCAFVYEKTKSGICVLILQFMLNMSAILLPVSPSGGGVNTYTTFAILYFIAMLGFMHFLYPIKKSGLIKQT